MLRLADPECSPEETRVLLAEEGSTDGVTEGRSLGHLTSGSQDPRVGEPTLGIGRSSASPTSSAGVRSCDGEPVADSFIITSG